MKYNTIQKYKIRVFDKNSVGFTLLETFVMIGVSSFALSAVTLSTIYFYRTNINAIEQAFALQRARTGIFEMVRVIREASFSEEGSFPVVAIAQNEFIFYSDFNHDGLVERVRYFLEDGFLKQGVIVPSGSPLSYFEDMETIRIVSGAIRNVEDNVPVFVYKNSLGEEIIDASLASSASIVDVTLIVNVNPVRMPKEFTLRSTASLRNLRDQ